MAIRSSCALRLDGLHEEGNAVFRWGNAGAPVPVEPMLVDFRNHIQSPTSHVMFMRFVVPQGGGHGSGGWAMQEVAMLKAVFLLGTVLVLSILPIDDHSAWAGQPPPRLGGPCEYKEYKGVAEVISVSRMASADNRGQDEFEVKCSFHPREQIEEQFAQTTAREFRLHVDNDANPTGRFIVRHGIKVGSRIPCIVRVIVRGTCTPVLFEFPWSGRAGK